MEFLPENSVLTPHVKELERLVGKWVDDFDKLQKAKEFSKKHKVILVLKRLACMCIDLKVPLL